MPNLVRAAVLSVVLLAGATIHASPIGDTFDFGWDGFFNDAFGGWIWGADGRDDGVTFDSAGGTIGNFTFGTTETFSFLGNNLVMETGVTDTGPTSETWNFSIYAQDGGPIFDPVDGILDINGGFFRAWHLREIFIGGEGETIGEGEEAMFVWNTADMLQSPTFVDFASPVGLQTWTSADSSSTWSSGESPASTGQPAFTPFGDLERDGVVDELDYDLWASEYGTTGVDAFAGADANGDGVVDAADYTTWRDNLGTDTRYLPDGVEEFFARAETPADPSDTTTGVLLNRQFPNPGLIMYDDGIFQARDPQVTRIDISVDVTTTGAATAAVPEPSTLVTALAAAVGLMCSPRARTRWSRS